MTATPEVPPASAGANADILDLRFRSALTRMVERERLQTYLQRNAIMAAFRALKDLDLVTVVDDDIDLRDPADVEYALATRMEASRDLITIPGARGHEYVRIGNNGIRTKLGIDATVPFAERARFTRCTFAPVTIDKASLTFGRTAADELLGTPRRR